MTSELDKYIVHGEPGKKEKADTWQTAIGLLDVDGLKVSLYLLDSIGQHKVKLTTPQRSIL